MTSIRLKNKEISIIVNSFINTFQHGELYLFGSRTDASRRGGDIDLYITPFSKTELSRKKIDFLVNMKKGLGEQKIDVVIDRNYNREIDKIAKDTGVLLCRN
ncbi:MAG: hypothetical protein WC071_05310 [Victivallaceae bacterium]